MKSISQSRVLTPEDKVNVQKTAFSKYFVDRHNVRIPTLRGFSEQSGSNNSDAWLRRNDDREWKQIRQENNSWCYAFSAPRFDVIHANEAPIVERTLLRVLNGITGQDICSVRSTVYSSDEVGRIAILYGSLYQSADRAGPGKLAVGKDPNGRLANFTIRREDGYQPSHTAWCELNEKNAYALVISLDQIADTTAYSTAKFMKNLGINVFCSLVEQKMAKKETPHKKAVIRGLQAENLQLAGEVKSLKFDLEKKGNRIVERDAQASELRTERDSLKTLAKEMMRTLEAIEQVATGKKLKGASINKIIAEAKGAIEEANKKKLL